MYNEYRHGSISPLATQNQESLKCSLVDLKEVRRAPGAQLTMEITARSLPRLPRVLPLLPLLLQLSIPTKMALIKDLMTPRSMAWNRRRVQCHHLFLRKRLPRNAGSNVCLARSSRLVSVRMCALIWWEASLCLAYLSCEFFFFLHSLFALKKKIGLEVWGRWDFRMEISHHHVLRQASPNRYNKPHPPVRIAIYSELLIKRKEDPQWVRRTDYRHPLIKHRCNLLFLRFLQSENQETAKGAIFRPKDKNSGTVHEWGFFRENLQCNKLGNTVLRKYITTYPRRIQGK